jgi:hypothetical protein
MDIDPAKLFLSIFDPKLTFLERAHSVYQFQIENSPVYKIFANHFVPAGEVPQSISNFPLLPIRAFKEAKLIANRQGVELTFKSSGTGSMARSQHHVADLEIYKRAILQGFGTYFNSTDFTLLCYAPGYSDNPDSSLLWMLKYLVGLDQKGLSRFLPLDEPLTSSDIARASQDGRKIILFGAAFGLLDLLEMDSEELPHSAHIIETGGMKTHRREMSKQELRNRLSGGFNLPLEQIHSEYGMCELMSQLYAIGSEWFEAPHWVHASVRDATNPQRVCEPGEEGKVAIIDLANLYSCPFILTEDRGVMNEEGKIAVLGRWHSAVLRGCNFLIDRD